MALAHVSSRREANSGDGDSGGGCYRRWVSRSLSAGKCEAECFSESDTNAYVKVAVSDAKVLESSFDKESTTIESYVVSSEQCMARCSAVLESEVECLQSRLLERVVELERHVHCLGFDDEKSNVDIRAQRNVKQRLDKLYQHLSLGSGISDKVSQKTSVLPQGPDDREAILMSQVAECHRRNGLLKESIAALREQGTTPSGVDGIAPTTTVLEAAEAVTKAFGVLADEALGGSCTSIDGTYRPLETDLAAWSHTLPRGLEPDLSLAATISWNGPTEEDISRLADAVAVLEDVSSEPDGGLSDKVCSQGSSEVPCDPGTLIWAGSAQRRLRQTCISQPKETSHPEVFPPTSWRVIAPESDWLQVPRIRSPFASPGPAQLRSPDLSNSKPVQGHFPFSRVPATSSTARSFGAAQRTSRSPSRAVSRGCISPPPRSPPRAVSRGCISPPQGHGAMAMTAFCAERAVSSRATPQPSSCRDISPIINRGSCSRQPCLTPRHPSPLLLRVPASLQRVAIDSGNATPRLQEQQVLPSAPIAAPGPRVQAPPSPLLQFFKATPASGSQSRTASPLGGITFRTTGASGDSSPAPLRPGQLPRQTMLQSSGMLPNFAGTPAMTPQVQRQSSATAPPLSLLSALQEASLRTTQPIFQVNSTFSSAVAPPATPRAPKQPMAAAPTPPAFQAPFSF